MGKQAYIIMKMDPKIYKIHNIHLHNIIIYYIKVTSTKFTMLIFKLHFSYNNCADRILIIYKSDKEGLLHIINFVCVVKIDTRVHGIIFTLSKRLFRRGKVKSNIDYIYILDLYPTLLLEIKPYYLSSHRCMKITQKYKTLIH